MLWGIPVLILWGFFFFFQNDPDMVLGHRITLAIIYVVSISIAIWIIQKVLIKRLRVFRTPIQILLKTLFYGAGILIGYLPVLVGEVLYKFSFREIIERVVPGIVKAVASLFILTTKSDSSQFFPPEVVSVLTSIFVLLLLTALVAAGLSYVDTRWIQFTAEKRLSDARLKILEMQMKPHFLFNSLNSISSLIKVNPDQAQDLLVCLSDFMRFNYNLGNRPEVSLQQELDFTKNYLLLNQARFGERLTWKIRVEPGCQQIKIPGMVIQPIVENALVHGWQRENSSFHIDLNCVKQDSLFLIKVVDNGKGIKKQYLTNSNFPPQDHALHNIRERLHIHYLKDNLMQIESEPNQGTKVTIKIPENS
jgi:anti-sigma regulatory factor (Ser/Thr protein kinase)